MFVIVILLVNSCAHTAEHYFISGKHSVEWCDFYQVHPSNREKKHSNCLKSCGNFIGLGQFYLVLEMHFTFLKSVPCISSLNLKT